MESETPYLLKPAKTDQKSGGAGFFVYVSQLGAEAGVTGRIYEKMK
jgi:hypothetical protein